MNRRQRNPTAIAVAAVAALLLAGTGSRRVSGASTPTQQPAASVTSQPPASLPAAAADAQASARQALIDQIIAADYAGDRPALDRLYQAIDAHLGDPTAESRMRYWKGFAKWRRAMNGANEDPWPADLVADIDLAVPELRRSGQLDSTFVDARIGEMQCLGLILFFDPERAKDAEHLARLKALLIDLKQTAADNPRYVWAWGMAYFNAPADRGGGPDNVIAAYLRALDGVRGGSAEPRTPLDPSWGEAELNVNLAYSYLNKPDPDLALAKQYVEKAIALVPNWHYARDILRGQIEAAQAQEESQEHPARTQDQAQ